MNIKYISIHNLLTDVFTTNNQPEIAGKFHSNVYVNYDPHERNESFDDCSRYGRYI